MSRAMLQLDARSSQEGVQAITGWVSGHGLSQPQDSRTWAGRDSQYVTDQGVNNVCAARLPSLTLIVSHLVCSLQATNTDTGNVCCLLTQIPHRLACRVCHNAHTNGPKHTSVIWQRDREW